MRRREVLRLHKMAEKYEKQTPHKTFKKAKREFIKDGLFVWMASFRRKHFNAVEIWIAQGKIVTPDYQFALFVINKIKNEGWRFIEKESGE